MTAVPDVVVPPAEFERRVIEPSDFVADRSAFIDVRLPRSQGKASYSMIGAGVSQNADQSINLVEPHGFNIGAASMPHGVVNNPHLHYTAEVFVCTRGQWRMNVGEHGDQTLVLEAGDIFATPTWIFRGFENVGPDDGWLFTVLGGDETGGILWAPAVLEAAAETGLYLAPDHSVIDANGEGAPAGHIRPMSADQLAAIDHYTDDQLESLVVRRADLDWNDRALLSSVLPGHASALAPVIGLGMTQHRGHRTPVTVPHGFSVEWLRIEPGSSVGLHRHDDSQAVFVVDGDFEVTVNRGDDRRSARPATDSVISVPPGAWRDFANEGSAPAHAIVVNGGDHRTRIEWDPEITQGAATAGHGLDAYDYVAPLALLGRRAS